MSDVDRPWDAPSAKPPGSSWSDVPLWMKLAAVISVLLLVGWWSAQSDNSASEAETSGDSYSAKSACKDFVKRQLKSPGTADFSMEAATSVGSTWTVTGVVDSQNSFGGVVRNGYRCKTLFTGDDDWRLIDLTTDGN